MKAIETDIQVTSIRSRADGSLGLSLITPELSNSDKVEFMNYHNVNAKMFSHPKDVSNLEELKIDKEAGAKSPSERLRSILYIYFLQKKPKVDFEVFYREKMESLINLIKQKLI